MEESPDTNEQFEEHELLILYHGAKSFIPSKYEISFGLILPHMFLSKKFTTNNIVIAPEIQI